MKYRLWAVSLAVLIWLTVATSPLGAATTSRIDYDRVVSRNIGFFQASMRSQPPHLEQLYCGVADISAYTGTDGGMRGDDITAMGNRAIPWVTVAAWPDIPFGSIVDIPELGMRCIVQDRGGAITYGHLDIYVGHGNKNDAFQFGRRHLWVRIYKLSR